ncbi:glycosyltransferase family 4 protein [Algivirga pacifica]|uniref:Glycosyl transferase family 1 domain-containing protein n=1 Tax=Algivirga pacifica TaxID=1162670 RepID=A0ABP9DQM5_9BACT
MNILILAPYPPTIAPSQRFRFEQYLDFLEEAGHTYTYAPFIDLSTWNILHKPGHFIQKAFGIIKAFGRRKLLMLKAYQYDCVFLHREASHIGPPVFEWFLAKVLGKKIIYDFDDAIWLPNYSEHNARFHWLKWYHKVPFIIKWSHKVSAGNEYLAAYAKSFNSNVIINPTTIDTEGYHNPILYPQKKNTKPIIGWTGTLTTSIYLKLLEPILQDLEERYDFEFRVISNEAPDLKLKSMVFQPWKKETEIQDLMQFDMGIMPLTEDKWAKGKCGFKALQYMALGIPALVSPVGVNKEIVDHQENGFICCSPKDWEHRLVYLLENPEVLHQMGEKARKKIEEHYSVQSNKDNFLELMNSGQ